jgi:hypothetical protein
MRPLLVLLLLSVALQRSAAACDCGIAPTEKTLLDKSAAIFVGRVVSEAKLSTTGAALAYQVEVLATWRGVDAGAIVSVSSEASDCGFRLGVGSTMLFFTNQKSETGQCTVDQDVRVPTAKALAFLGPPKAEVSDKVLATCACSTAPLKGKKPDFEFRAGKPVADGRYMVSIPLTTKRRPKDRFKDAPLPTSILSPAGGCQLRAPSVNFWFASPAFGETTYANRCVADQLRVR